MSAKALIRILRRIRSWLYVPRDAIALLVVASIQAGAQDACVALLQHGIYDHFRESNVNASASEMYNNVCSAYSKYESNKSSVGGGASYGLFSANVSVTGEQLQAIGQTMCTTNQSAGSASGQLNTMKDVISQAGAAAFTECVAQYADGLHTNTKFREDDDNMVAIDVRYVAPVGTQATTQLTGITIDPASGLQCSGPLWNMRNGSNTIGNSTYGMSCSRPAVQNAHLDQGRMVYASPVTVSIYTKAGTVIRTLSYKLAGPPPTPLVIPIGTVIAFTGTAADAQSQTQSGWWICDGRVVADPASTAFNGKATPNLVDKFLVGSTAAATLSGAPFFDVPDRPINVVVNGFASYTIHMDPRLLIIGGQTWQDGNPHTGAGTLPGIRIPTIPPSYSVIYLIKVK